MKKQFYYLEGSYCPECCGTLHEVQPENEKLLWCDTCDVCIDSDGGITN